jgi:hypothetical protein
MTFEIEILEKFLKPNKLWRNKDNFVDSKLIQVVRLGRAWQGSLLGKKLKGVLFFSVELLVVINYQKIMATYHVPNNI